MEVCPNCTVDLVKKKYIRSNRLKCMCCGYETSDYEEEQETKEFLERLKEGNEHEHYKDNENTA